MTYRTDKTWGYPTQPRSGRSTWRQKATVLLVCTVVAVVGLRIADLPEITTQETTHEH